MQKTNRTPETASFSTNKGSEMDQASFGSHRSERAEKAKSLNSEKLPTSKHYNATPGARMQKKMAKKTSQDLKKARTEKTGF